MCQVVSCPVFCGHIFLIGKWLCSLSRSMFLRLVDANTRPIRESILLMQFKVACESVLLFDFAAWGV